ncbi:16892_t:CDS:1 [Dentiscutata heterogama]|uniref:16892_t:CDS:1 n=1 Tax=Dentiscutata heterogama TaxID=1316150 RepID=A0ACA9L1Y3_9GLOM|nr:16892_t:CDS:1 [Dentiscutata heterogama]
MATTGTIAGVLSFSDENKDRNVQGFQGLTFLIKVEKFQDEDTQARLFFLDGDPPEECDVPFDIKCKEINENNNVKNKSPFFRTNFFMINHPKKYEIYHKDKKIFAMIPEKNRYTIHNFDKPDNVKQYEVEKRVGKAINTVIKYESIV